MSSIDEVKAQTDIVDLIGESVQLRKSGKNYTGFCPFHPNTRTPAFVVFPDTGTWRCFGQCNEGGDIFHFVMKKEGWDFSEALRRLAERAGVQLKVPTAQELQAAEEHEGLRSLLEEAVTFYRHNLLSTPAGKPALNYLREKRLLSDETMEIFGIGYAPNSYEATMRHFLSKGYKVDDLAGVGLVSERDDGRVYDRFRHRVMFPIRDQRGRMAGFGARILNPDDVPKFLNSPQTELFDKSKTLYGLDRARKAIRDEDQAVIVEGYLDVIALHQAGYRNVVSPMGTALTGYQLRMLKRFSRRIVLALDPDAAGDQATLRGLEVARQVMDREQDPVFDARGLLGHEARLQADIRVTTLPEGLDPDEVVNRDPQEWERILENTRPVVIHVMETLASGRDLDDPKVKTEIASQVLPLIQDVPSSVERDTYRQRLARLLHVDERSLLEGLGPSGRRSKARRRTPRTRESLHPRVVSSTARSHALEGHCLGILLRSPDLLYKVDRILQEANLNRLAADDFQHADHQAIFRLLLESIDQDVTDSVNFVQNHFSLSMMELADDMLARTADLDPEKDSVQEDLVRGLLELRRRNLRQSIEYIRFLMEEAQEQDEKKIAQHTEAVVQLSKVLNSIERAIAMYTGEGRLLARKGQNGDILLR